MRCRASRTSDVSARLIRGTTESTDDHANHSGIREQPGLRDHGSAFRMFAAHTDQHEGQKTCPGSARMLGSVADRETLFRPCRERLGLHSAEEFGGNCIKPALSHADTEAQPPRGPVNGKPMFLIGPRPVFAGAACCAAETGIPDQLQALALGDGVHRKARVAADEGDIEDTRTRKRPRLPAIPAPKIYFAHGSECPLAHRQIAYPADVRDGRMFHLVRK